MGIDDMTPYQEKIGDTALVILSGGQDSATCLFWAKTQFSKVEAITFNYGQRHRIEIDCAIRLAGLADVHHEIIKETALSEIGNSALMDSCAKIVIEDGELPSTFVPGRNLVFLSLAGAFAYKRGIYDVVMGVNQVDYSGYPDCRLDAILAQQSALCLGMNYRIQVHTPLINLNKKEIVEMAKRLGVISYMQYTHTCYNGVRPPCGECPACVLREHGFKAAGEVDPLLSVGNWSSDRK